MYSVAADSARFLYLQCVSDPFQCEKKNMRKNKLNAHEVAGPECAHSHGYYKMCSAEFNELHILLFAQCTEQAINIPDKIIGVKPQWQKKQRGKVFTLRLMINTFFCCGPFLRLIRTRYTLAYTWFRGETHSPQHIHNMFWFIHHSLWNFDFAVLCVAHCERAKFFNRSFCVRFPRTRIRI